MNTKEQLLEAENQRLKSRIAELEAEFSQYRPQTPTPPSTTSTTLLPDEYKRYGRQLILREIGLPGQQSLKASSILIVGLGGLGSPASLYLAGAGIETLGLLDHDTVESSNLHRQIVHRTPTVSLPKVESASQTLSALNPHVNLRLHHIALTPENALDIVEQYDVVLDCTDHPTLRYLISDACVLRGKPLVSASALRTDGQLMVLNYPPGEGACYRCVWPRPPPSESVVSCGEGGILGPVVGVMGVMQALEAIKIVTGQGRRGGTRLELFSAYAETMWRSVRMRGKRAGCVSCGTGEITEERVKGGGVDYVAFCGGVEGGEMWAERVTVQEVKENMGLVIDVRDQTQFGICSLKGSVNVPFDEFSAAGEELPERVQEEIRKLEDTKPVYVLCRFGNDSQIAGRRIQEKAGLEKGKVKDVIGGTAEWARKAPEDGFVDY